MKEIEKLKEAILRDYPHLTLESEFSFACHPGVPCFNNCCADVNIFLTPYDIIRLKNRLGISSAEFLSKYTISPFDKNLKYPVVMLAMNEDDKKACQFVTDDGCSVYEDRPWACRMYPLGLASPKDADPDDPKQELKEEFYFLLEESICKGFKSDRKQTVAQWLKDQGIVEYDMMGREWKDLAMHPFLQDPKNSLTPQKIEMFFMVCYNLDTFRDFVFKSSFLNKFEVDAETQAKIKDDDVELLRFGFKWLRFSLFGEKSMTVKGEVFDAKAKQIDERNKALSAKRKPS